MNRMMKLYEDTIADCKYCEENNLPLNLLKNIGILRGIILCLDAIGVYMEDNDTVSHFIDIQYEMTMNEHDQEFYLSQIERRNAQ